MEFNSLQYLVFLLIGALIYFGLPFRLRKYWLLILSIYFYIGWSYQFFLLVIISALLDFSGALLIEGSRVRGKPTKPYLIASILGNLSILCYFKYSVFFTKNVNAVLGHDLFVIRYVVLPVGISFYTFQSMAYTIDVYRGIQRAKRNFLEFLLFVNFFPQLVAGPIERSVDLMPQFDRRTKVDGQRIASGIIIIALGLFKKTVVADRAAVLVDLCFKNVSHTSGFASLVGAYAFAFQIFCDFSGYTDIAIGSAKIFGFDLTNNFNAPYFSLSLTDFWRRWHITLSSWFRDYVYHPLGGNKEGLNSTLRNVLVVFLVSGLWHGASWTFVLWGLYHGLIVISERLFNIHVPKVTNKFARGFRRFFVFNVVVLGWILFRSESVSLATEYMSNIAHIKNGWFDLSFFNGKFSFCEFLVLIVSSVFILFYERVIFQSAMKIGMITFRNLLLFAVLVMTIIFFGYPGGADFIYFQF